MLKDAALREGLNIPWKHLTRSGITAKNNGIKYIIKVIEFFENKWTLLKGTTKKENYIIFLALLKMLV